MAAKIKRIDLIIILFFLFLFVFNLSHHLDTRDSGEFLVCAKKLIPAHPPGSVLYIIIGKLFTFFGPMGMNFLSLLFSMLSILILLKLEKNDLFYRLLILLLFSGNIIAYYSTTTEVYTFVLFLISLIVFFSQQREYEALSFTAGLLAVLSPVYFVLSLPFIISDLMKARRKKKILFLLLLPLLLYLFITIRLPYIKEVFSFNALNKTFDFITGKDFNVKNNVLSFDYIWITKNINNLFLKAIKSTPFFIILMGIIFYRVKVRKNLKVFFTLIVYFLFFIMLSLDVRNIFHFFIPVIPFVLILFKDIDFRFNKITQKMIFVIGLLFLVFNIMNIDVIHTALPLTYAKDVIKIVKSPAVVIVSIDNRINYFNYLKEYTDFIDKDITFINLADLSKDYYIKTFSSKIKLPQMIDRNPLVNLNNIIALNDDILNIYFDADPSIYGLILKVKDHGLLFSTNVPVSSSEEIYEKIKHITDFHYKSDDPEFKNLIISYKIAFYSIKNNIKDIDSKKRIDNWLTTYSY